MRAGALLLLACCLSRGSALSSEGGHRRPKRESCGCQPQPRSFDVDYRASVNETCKQCFSFPYDFSTGQNWTARVCVRSVSAGRTPLLVVARQSVGAVAFEVPLTLKKHSAELTDVCRTLCPLSHYEDTAFMDRTVQKIVLDFWSKSDTLFEFRVEMLKSFNVGTNELVPLNLTVSKPVVMEYAMTDSFDALRIEATSSSLKCAILSVEDIQCPFHDVHQSVQQGGFFETFTKTAAISIERQSFHDGFYIVLLLNPDDADCVQEESKEEKIERMEERIEELVGGQTERVKDVTVRVTPAVDYHKSYGYVIWLPAALFFILAIVFSAFFLGCSCWNTFSCWYKFPYPFYTCWKLFTSCCYSCMYPEDLSKLQYNPEKDTIFKEKFLFVSDLVEKKPWSHKSYIYSWNLVIVAIFYGLPALQLVYVTQSYMRSSGNLDECYYNFLCANQVGIFSDFNHVFSNIGYMILGLTFLIIVLCCEIWDPDSDRNKMKAERDAKRGEDQRTEIELKNCPEGQNTENEYVNQAENTNSGGNQNNPSQTAVLIPESEPKGLPGRYGLYYAMGWALFMEGVMSACYHVCPKKANFQFDTTFMYVISTVCIMKLYYSRHSSIIGKAHTFWMMLAFSVFLPLSGMMFHDIAFYLLLVAFQLLLLYVVVVYLYYDGKIEFVFLGELTWTFWNFWVTTYPKNEKKETKECAVRNVRTAFLSITVVAIIAVDVATIMLGCDSNTVVLAFFITCLALYTVYYSFAKAHLARTLRGRVSERLEKELSETQLKSVILLVVSLGFGAAAVVHFVTNRAAWEKSPAGSRVLNRHCKDDWAFYDEHDVWHFLSSISIFFIYMFLLTVDSDLKDKPRSQIVVF